MSDLKLDSLRIQNFRTFRDLTIDRLGRVNLIVGKNNVGKTALMEAAYLWMQRGRLNAIKRLLEDRDELNSEKIENHRYSRRQRVMEIKVADSIQNLFNREDSSEAKSPMLLGPCTGKRDLRLSIESPKQATLFDAEEREEIDLVVSFGKHRRKARYQLAQDFMHEAPGWHDRRSLDPSHFMRSNGLSDRGRAKIWDHIVEEGPSSEKKMMKFMNIVDDRVQDVRFTGSDPRIPLVGLKGISERIPLRSMGGGMIRVLDYSIALVDTEGGVLLIDELENGLHYSVQSDLWEMIFETAQELDVQVFATTHSYDCVQAFQQASGEHEEEGMLISLRRKRSDPEEIVAVPIDEEELEYAVETHTDVR
jgi:AAA15 family ATPase/GTPase